MIRLTVVSSSIPGTEDNCGEQRLHYSRSAEQVAKAMLAMVWFLITWSILVVDHGQFLDDLESALCERGLI